MERVKFGNTAEGSVDAFGQFGREVEARLEAGRKFREAEAAQERARVQKQEPIDEAQAAK